MHIGAIHLVIVALLLIYFYLIGLTIYFAARGKPKRPSKIAALMAMALAGILAFIYAPMLISAASGLLIALLGCQLEAPPNSANVIDCDLLYALKSDEESVAAYLITTWPIYSLALVIWAVVASRLFFDYIKARR